MNQQVFNPWIMGFVIGAVLLFALFLLYTFAKAKEASRTRRGAYVAFMMSKLITGQKNARPTSMAVERDIVPHVIRDLKMRLDHWTFTSDDKEIKAEFDGKVWRFPIEG
jgi:hypothetical protein